MRFVPLAALAAALFGCAPPGAFKAEPPPAVVGRIELSGLRQIAATPAEIANAATVSLIDPVTGNTIATTLSTPEGRFILTFTGTTFTPGPNPYFLEASKGLAPSGGSNQPGWSVVRLRTLLRQGGEGWESLSKNALYLSRSTTALSVLSSLKGLTTAQNNALLNTLSVGAPSTVDGITSTDTFDGTPAVTTSEYQRVWDLVYRVLDQNADPIAAIVMRPAATASVDTDLGSGYGLRPGFGWTSAGLVLADVYPAAATVGSTLTLYGHGLLDGVSVRLNGLPCPVLTAEGTTASFRLPTGATSGNLEVRYGPWINRSLFLTVL